MTRHVRQLIDLERVPTLTEGTTAQVLAMEMRLLRVPCDQGLAIGRFGKNTWDRGSRTHTPLQMSLAHHLSSHIEQRSPSKQGSDARSPIEKAALAHHQARLTGAIEAMKPGSFASAMVALSETLLGRKGVLRRGPLVLRSSDDSAFIELPGIEALGAQLDALGKLLAGSSAGSRFVRACVAYVGLLNAHPFEDGNGRVARVVFNLELRRLGMPNDAYVPLYAAMCQSRGGYEIRLRQAELHGEWDPLVRYLCRVVEIATHPGDPAC
jgi:hypothetical protein